MKHYNVKAKLGHARNVFGLPEEVYQFAEYAHKSMDDAFTPEDAYWEILNTVRDLQNRQFAMKGNFCFPEYVLAHTDQVIANAGLIMQIIDEMTDAEFSSQVRECFVQEGTIPIPIRRITVDDTNLGKKLQKTRSRQIASAVLTTARWWTGAIQANYGFSFSEEQILKFYERIADSADTRIVCDHVCVMTVEDGHINFPLGDGLEVFTGITERRLIDSLPRKVLMYAQSNVVKVLVDDATEFTTIWKAK